MCGITGYFSLDGSRIDPKRFAKGLDAIKHRGPDDQGFGLFHSQQMRCALITDLPADDTALPFAPDLLIGHRRLSIIDLSPAGRQPMTDAAGAFWIVFNGEIYNYLELREELQSLGRSFCTETDTEVILNAYAQWGTDCLSKLNGMFAFALWDQKTRTLFCARDRFGVKPFYYYYDGRRFLFASEIKALLEMGAPRGVNQQIVHDYLAHGFVDHTHETFFHGILQLRAAHFLLISGQGLRIARWWDIQNEELQGLSDGEYARRFSELFEDAVRLRLRSDVPVGTCLSGGLDSSSIVCVANKIMFQSPFRPEIVGDRQRTFSSCFEDRKYDERDFIEKVVHQTNVRSYCTFPEVTQFFNIIPRLVWFQDEPFGSTSIFAQWHVMQLARQHGVVVLLDGQGADELLAGYHGYFGTYYSDLTAHFRLLRLYSELAAYRRIHGPFSPMIMAALARAFLPHGIIRMLRKMPFIDRVTRQATIGNGWIDADFRKAYSREYVFQNRFSSNLKNHLYALLTDISLPALLHYEDRNSMAFSIEARVPFLDYRLVEYAFSLPAEQKLRNGMTKIVLRNAMQGVLPEPVRVRTDKMGFVTPESVWFRTVLKDRVHEIIESSGFRDLGYFDVQEVRKEFVDHCNSKKDISLTIWRWLNLFLWHKTFFP